MDNEELFYWLPDFDTYLDEDILVFLTNIQLVKYAGQNVGALGCKTFFPSDFLDYFSVEAFVSELRYKIEHLQRHGLHYSGFTLTSENNEILYFFNALNSTLCALLNPKINEPDKDYLCSTFWDNEDYSDIYYKHKDLPSCIKEVCFKFCVSDLPQLQYSASWLNSKFDTYLAGFESRSLKLKKDLIVYSDILHQKLFCTILESGKNEQGIRNLKIDFKKSEYEMDGKVFKKDCFRLIEYAFLLHRKKEWKLNAVESGDVFCVDILPKIEDIELDQQNQKKRSYEKLNIFDPEFRYLQRWERGSLIEEISFSNLPAEAIKYIHNQYLTESKKSVTQLAIEKKVSSSYQNIFRKGAQKRHETSSFLRSRKKQCELIRPYAIEIEGKVEFFD